MRVAYISGQTTAQQLQMVSWKELWQKVYHNFVRIFVENEGVIAST